MINPKHTAYDLIQMQSLPLDIKIRMTKERIRQWYEYWDGQVYVSFSGGKDSTVLKHIVDSMYDDVLSLFVNTGLEYPEIQKFAMSQKNVVTVRPEMRFDEVIKKYGYPVVSKEISKKVKDGKMALEKGNDESYALKQFNGEYLTKNGKTSIYNIKKWKFLLDAPFKIHNQCCDVMKKKPAKQYTKETGRKPIIGTMAAESRLRYQHWLENGCNAFDKKAPSSQPLSFWTEQDILQYIYESDIKIPSVYGEVIKQDNKYSVTGVTRTGCIFCPIGCHLDNRFQQLHKTHPKLWEYVMYQLHLKEFLDYVGEKRGKQISYY